MFQTDFIPDENLPGFASLKRPDDPCRLQLVNKAAGPVVPQFQFALNEGCATLLMLHDEARGFLDELPKKDETYTTPWMEDEDGDSGVALSGGQ